MAMILLKTNSIDGLPIDGVESIVNLDNVTWIKPVYMSTSRSTICFTDGSERMIESPYSEVKTMIQNKLRVVL